MRSKTKNFIALISRSWHAKINQSFWHVSTYIISRESHFSCNLRMQPACFSYVRSACVWGDAGLSCRSSSIQIIIARGWEFVGSITCRRLVGLFSPGWAVGLCVCLRSGIQEHLMICAHQVTLATKSTLSELDFPDTTNSHLFYL